MAKCYICNCELDIEHTKPEHIIPNGIGGKLKSREILCNKHNNELYELDELICEDLKNQTNQLNPSRDNGGNPSVVCEYELGEKIIKLASGEYYSKKPNIKIDKLSDGKIAIKYSTFYSTGSQHKNFAKQQLLKQKLTAKKQTAHSVFIQRNIKKQE